jgi:hypothetical protein
MATQPDFKVEVPESITRSIKEPEIEKYEFKKEEVRQRNVLEEIAHRMLDQSKKEIQKPQESIASERTPTVPSKEIQRPQESIAPRREPTPEPAITEYNATNNVFDQQRQRLENSKHLNFVRRILIPESNPLALESKDSAGRSVIETHRMAAEVIDRGQLKGNWIVYPTIIEREQGRLERLSEKDAQDHALRTGEFINFGGKNEDALNFSKNYKLSVPRFNGYFKERWETRQEEEKKESPIVSADLVSSGLEPEKKEESRFNSIMNTINSIDLRLPLNIRQLTHDIVGGNDPITKADLKESEYQALVNATQNALQRKSSIIEYIDYQTQEGSREGSQYRDVGGGGTNKEFFSLLSNPSYALKTTLGQATISLNEDGEVIIEDRYNFNNATDKFKFIDFVKGVKDSGFSPYAQARNVGTFLGSGPGEGSIVEINLGKLNDSDTLKLQNLIASGGSGD